MPLFLIITKLLFLKVLIALADDNDYRPRADELGNLMLETRRTWTGDVLTNERHRPWHGPLMPQQRSDGFSKTVNDNRAGEYFTPKYQYEREKYDYETNLNLKWPGMSERVLRKPLQMHNFEQTRVASSPIAVRVAAPTSPLQNVGSSFNFKLFSDEKFDENENFENDENKSAAKPTLKPQIFDLNPTSESVFNTYSASKTQITTKKPLKTEQNQAMVIAIHAEDSNERANDGSVKNSWTHKYGSANNSEKHFPIFFTNPVTGIVYAITEIGRMDQNLTKYSNRKDNNTIPIYITKEQYDRDISNLKEQLQNQCTNTKQTNKRKSSMNPALTGGAVTTTRRPQIIKVQKPIITRRPSVSKLPTEKLPVNTYPNKPSPVMVQTSVTVSDQVQLPPPKRPQKLRGKKKKKKKRPGRKSAPGVAQTSANKAQKLQIIVGTTKTPTTVTTTKRPIATKQRFPAQLERPNLPATTTTIFSQQPIAATSGYVIPKPQILKQSNSYANHRLKRSLEAENGTTEKPLLATTPTATKPMINATSGQLDIDTRKEVVLPKLASNATKLVATKLGSNRQNNTLRFVRKKQMTTTKNVASKDIKTVTVTQRNLSAATQQKQTLANTRNRYHYLKNKKKSTKNDKDDVDYDDDDGFGFFDFLEDDDADDETAKDDDDDYENDDYYEDEKNVNTPKKPKREVFHTNIDDSESIESYNPNSADESNDELKESVTHENSSSAEEGVDFGALEEFDVPLEAQHEATPTLYVDDNTASKNTNGKKRIRRRPASSSASESYEDYNDRDQSDKYEANDDHDDGDEDGDGVGVGDFFRMIFYPVQMVMTRVFDAFAGADSGEEYDGRPTYPTYTQYSSANKIDASGEDDDEAQGNSLGSWFGYLFGFNRRTKKIGSTTTAPPIPTADSTEAPGWFEYWFGGSKNTNSAETSASSEDYDDYDKWFASWFGTKPNAKRRTATTTTTTTPTLPQVPILTIVDPMKNPQNWLGILAHHIINSTATTTHHPNIGSLTRPTTTENPDLPRFVSYDKYQIWRLKPQDESQVKALIEYKKSDDGMKLQWLKGPSMRGLTDVLVPPKMFVDFQGALQFESIAHEILIFDVGKAIAYEQNKEQFHFTTPRPTKQQHKQKYASLINMSWNKYHAYDDIVKYLESVRMRHPQIVELFHIGRSYEGRPLIVAKLEMKHAMSSAQNAGSTMGNHKKLRHKKKSGHASAVFLEAGTHGSEWIAPATATWMINEILRIMKSNKTATETDVVRNTAWYIMPVLNPDGYVYSHEYDRFWRKSRSRHISRPNGLLDSAMTWLQQKRATEKVCYGVDLDRNWHYQWGKRGSSKSPCNEHFAGPAPFSEPETKALSEFLMDNRKQIKLFVSMQAYGQIISYPIKANVTFDIERLEDFMDVAMVGIDGLRKKGSKSRYKIDSSYDLIEHRAGCSDAFAAFEIGTPFSYTLYLADNGVHGYLLPSSSIESTARDAFEIVTAMLDYI